MKRGIGWPSNRHVAGSQTPPSWRTCNTYLLVLTWGFIFFSAARVVSYLPMLWIVWQAQDSSQHSLWTWVVWLGGNLTMAAWLYEHNEGRIDHAVLVTLINAAMCAATLALVVWFRF